MEQHEAVETLNDLVEINKESAKAFKRAAANVQDTDLSTLFTTCSEERAEIVHDLRGLIVGMGAEPTDDGGAIEAVRRGWLNIKAAMTIESDKTDAVVTAELEAKETEVLAAYENALAQELPQTVETSLRDQVALVRRTQERLHQLAEEVEEKPTAAYESAAQE